MSERTVQKVLKRLETAGLVTGKLERKGGRKYRFLTEVGRETANKYKEVRETLKRVDRNR